MFNNKRNRLFILLGIILVILFISIGLPSYARYKNRTKFVDITAWDGSVATSFKAGTGSSSDPYIISNGAELAYFAETLKDTDYTNKYVLLSNDIVINSGLFNYSDGVITYKLDNTIYYVKNNTDEYYSEPEFTHLIGRVHEFDSLNRFNGTFKGDSNTIYGLYMESTTSDKLALFTNLTGTIDEVYVENAFIYGGYNSAILASDASNTEIKNVFTSGNVVTNDNTSGTATVTYGNVTTTSTSHDLNVNEVVKGYITSSTISGTVSSLEVPIYINGTELTSTNFVVDLGTNKLNKITITSSVSGITFENLEYTANYQYSYAAGIVADASNVTLTNVINKANIYGNLDAAGLIGIARNTNISQSYNKGNITAVNGAGLVNYITLDSVRTNISNSYNSGTTNSGSIINTVSNSAQITISNVFSANNDYFINKISDTTVFVNNTYNTSNLNVHEGSVSGTINKTTLSTLTNKTFAKGTLSFYEFVDLDNLEKNSENVWVYEEGELPILYLDDLTNPIASIHAGTYAWDDLGYKLRKLKFNSNITYNVAAKDDLRPLGEVYYYIHKSTIPMKKSEIESIDEWETYTGVQTITEQGYYIIYAKVIDEYSNVYYMNTDLLILDLTGAEISITVNNKDYTGYSNPGYLYLDESKNVTLSAEDEYSGVKSLEYITSQTVLTEKELDAVTNWTTYKNPIVMNSITPTIIYVKATDNCEFVTYANTDFITLNGFTSSDIILGKGTSNNNDNIFITDKSSITLKFTYNDNNEYLNNEVHNLVSSILLPVGTKISIYDLNNKETYKYEILSSNEDYGYNTKGYATYPLSLFKNASISSSNTFFDESDYREKSIDEDFKVTIDFSGATINEDYNDVNIYMNISNTKETRSTLLSSIKTFNVIDNSDSALYLESDYEGGIILNSDSSITIDFETGFNDQKSGKSTVIDTTHENESIGIMVKVFDSNDNQINKRNIRNLVLSLDGKEYASDSQGVFRIDLKNGISVSNKSLVVRTKQDNVKLSNGTYYLKIKSYVANDGVYSSDVSSDEVSIPITVTNSNNAIKYSFNVSFDDSYRIISKDEDRVSLSFNLYEDGAFASPNIRVSLYKKSRLTAYDQSYELVDLSRYTNTNLRNYSGYIYFANSASISGVSSVFNLNLLPNELECTGYKFVFDLYDGNTKIGSLEKKFIVR